ncbi:MAG TPA: hypothetical protein PKH33_08580 [bacterium]|nr:hypothetical protein [bacterium]
MKNNRSGYKNKQKENSCEKHWSVVPEKKGRLISLRIELVKPRPDFSDRARVLRHCQINKDEVGESKNSERIIVLIDTQPAIVAREPVHEKPNKKEIENYHQNSRRPATSCFACEPFHSCRRRLEESESKADVKQKSKRDKRKFHGIKTDFIQRAEFRIKLCENHKHRTQARYRAKVSPVFTV